MLNDVPQFPEALDVSGSVVVYFDCDAGDVAITDTATGQTTHVPGTYRGLRVAGRYLAWVTGHSAGIDDGVMVYDWKGRVPVYAIPESMTHGVVWDLDLNADGVLALPTPAGHNMAKLTWASPDSPKLHRIPVSDSSFYQARLVGSRVVYQRGLDSGGEMLRAEIGLSDLQGGARTLAKGSYGATYEVRFAFDGKRIAWYAYSCRGARLHVQPISSETIRESLRRCPLRFRKPAKVTGGRYVRLVPNCYGYSRYTCDNRHVVLRLASNQHSIVGSGKHAKRVRLNDEGARRLKEHGKLRVLVTATMVDRTGIRERRRGRITIRDGRQRL
jgi:hypothetical protein